MMPGERVFLSALSAGLGVLLAALIVTHVSWQTPLPLGMLFLLGVLTGIALVNISR